MLEREKNSDSKKETNDKKKNEITATTERTQDRATDQFVDSPNKFDMSGISKEIQFR